MMNVTSSLSSVNWTWSSITTLKLVNIGNLQFGSTPSNVIPANVATLVITTTNMNLYLIPLSMFQLGSFPRLQSIMLQGILNGSLSADLSTLTKLSTLDLSYNNIGGALDVVSWGNMTSLAYVLLGTNNFTSFGSAFINTPTVQQLYVNSNPNLAGTFPPYLLQSSTFNQM